jgi:ribosomal protein S18 acetylase RimI-like enzyme
MIRRLGPGDAWAWRALWIEALTAFPQAFLTTLEEVASRPDEALMRDLEARTNLGLFAEGRLAGTSGLAPQEPAASAHRARIAGFTLTPSRQGTSDADRLLSATEAEARAAGFLQLELDVLASNARALRFYRRHGFVQTGRTPRAVRRNGAFEDDLHMVKPLD